MDCIFCKIIAGTAPADFRYQSTEFIIIVNKLTWVPTMLLAIPTQHMSQQELWKNPMLPKLSEQLINLGSRLAPCGFRILSNFGPDAMQSQKHAHIHLIGGVQLGPYA